MLAAKRGGGRTAGRARRLGWQGIVLLLIVAVTITISAGPRSGAEARHGAGENPWVTSWSASPQRPVAGTLAASGFDHQTIRDIIVTSVGGDLVRLELSNLYGTSPLQIGHVTVAAAEAGAAVAAVSPGTVYQVTYRGHASFQIPAGAQIRTDPVAMQVEPLQQLAVSIYLPDRTGPATDHWDAQQFNWVSVPGDHAADPDAVAFDTATLSWYYLSGLSVQSAAANGTVVTIGDSITDGVGSSTGTDTRWPNDLARRLDALSGLTLAVADAGIGGNQLLTGTRRYGDSAETRFGRDVLDQPGVRDVIVLEGINDIGFTTAPGHRAVPVSPARMIAGYQQLIARAHARGLRIFGATLLPFQGAGYYSAEGNATREAVNTWIRTSGAFDGVIDFDAVMRDPADPLRLDPAYDSGDHLHPNDAGYQAMANAIDLNMLLIGDSTAIRTGATAGTASAATRDAAAAVALAAA